MADSDTVTGLVERGFEALRDAFAENFEQGRELGAAFCMHVEGRKVVDLYGGSFDGAGTRPYGPEALQLVFSTTKGATAVCAWANSGQYVLTGASMSRRPRCARRRPRSNGPAPLSRRGRTRCSPRWDSPWNRRSASGSGGRAR